MKKVMNAIFVLPIWVVRGVIVLGTWVMEHFSSAFPVIPIVAVICNFFNPIITIVTAFFIAFMSPSSKRVLILRFIEVVILSGILFFAEDARENLQMITLVICIMEVVIALYYFMFRKDGYYYENLNNSNFFSSTISTILSIIERTITLFFAVPITDLINGFVHSFNFEKTYKVSDFFAARKYIKGLSRDFWEILDDGTKFLMRIFDMWNCSWVFNSFSFYYEKTVDKQEINDEADMKSSSLIGSRSVGMIPLIINQDILDYNACEQFKLEFLNRISYLFWD